MIDLPPALIVLGIITGMTYGLLAIGLILVYRSSGIINFALGNIGGVAAAVMGRLSLSLGLPWLVVFPIALASGALAAGALEILVMRRLRRAPRVMAIVATLGAGQLLLGIAGSITQIRNTALFPPPFNLSFEVGSLLVTPYYVLILILSPVLLAALVLFLAPPEWMPPRIRSRFGPAIRASADNPEAARTLGISADAMSTIAWMISGAIAAFAAILIAPARGFQTIDALGPDLLVRALAPAVLAGMSRLPTAFLAAVAVGVFEQTMLWNVRSGGPVEAGLFLVIVGGLLITRRGDETAADSSWLTLPHDRPLSDALEKVWTVRNLGRMTAIAVIAVALVLPLGLTNERSAVFVQIFSLATIGLSITVITGLSGQVSLGQFAVAGMGAFAAYTVFIEMDIAWGASLVAAAAAGGIVSLLIGLPALRLRGLMLAVTTLSFGVMAPASIFGSRWAFGTGVDPGRPIIGNAEIVLVRVYYYVALAALLIASWIVHKLRSGGVGRLLIAIRDNEDVARSFGVGATARKLQAFVISGIIAGLGGAVFAQSTARLNIESFPAARSVSLLAMVVLGGISRVSGSILGAMYLVGLPLLIPVNTVDLMVTGVGVLVFVLYVPGGISQLLDQVRLAIVGVLARRHSLDISDSGAATTPESVANVPRLARSAASPAALRATDLAVSYGQVRALDGLSFEVRAGETLGIIGPNGSGKTTLYKVLSGFLDAERGSVTLDGTEITKMRPEDRVRLGVVRSFQDSMLFPTLTVLDTVRLALERRIPTGVISSATGFPTAKWAEEAKDRGARELVGLLGLDPFKDKLMGELSTGTRRIAELCCLVALQPRVLLLDEPSSGIAQRETESLGEFLIGVKEQVGTTLVVIEHDMPLIMGISDRIMAMASGRKIAEGSPSEVQSDPLVVESYLGTVEVAIARSGRR